MVSITRDSKNRTYYIQIVIDDKRFKLRHHFRNRQVANAVAARLEDLKRNRGIDPMFWPETKRWVDELFQKDPTLYQKIARMNLVIASRAGRLPNW